MQQLNFNNQLELLNQQREHQENLRLLRASIDRELNSLENYHPTIRENIDEYVILRNTHASQTPAYDGLFRDPSNFVSSIINQTPFLSNQDRLKEEAIFRIIETNAAEHIRLLNRFYVHHKNTLPARREYSTLTQGQQYSSEFIQLREIYEVILDVEMFLNATRRSSAHQTHVFSLRSRPEIEEANRLRIISEQAAQELDQVNREQFLDDWEQQLRAEQQQEVAEYRQNIIDAQLLRRQEDEEQDRIFQERNELLHQQSFLVRFQNAFQASRRSFQQFSERLLQFGWYCIQVGFDTFLESPPLLKVCILIQLVGLLLMFPPTQQATLDLLIIVGFVIISPFILISYLVYFIYRAVQIYAEFEAMGNQVFQNFCNSCVDFIVNACR